MKTIRNIAASHRAKLLTLARSRGDDFQFLLGRWIIERFLYRLAGSKHKNDFVLKGAMLFLARDGELYRPTKDLDLLGFGGADLTGVTGRIREICSASAEDGIVFNVDGIDDLDVAKSTVKIKDSRASGRQTARKMRKERGTWLKPSISKQPVRTITTRQFP